MTATMGHELLGVDTLDPDGGLRSEWGTIDTVPAPEPTRMAAPPVTSHLRALGRAGVAWAEVAAATGLHVSTIYDLAGVHGRGDPLTLPIDRGQAILAIPIPERPDTSWEDRAACHGLDPAIFFPEKGEDVGPALDVCATCPVIEECREAHLHEAFGVWGGLTVKGRNRERKARRQAAA